MKYRRRFSDRISHERWLVSYADFVTLLFAFFVVMYASAQMDHKKAGRLSVAIESAFEQLGVFQTDAAKPGNIIRKPLSGSRTPGTIPRWSRLGLPVTALGRRTPIASKTISPPSVVKLKKRWQRRSSVTKLLFGPTRTGW